MARPNWVYWKEQGMWRAHPEGSPDHVIHAPSFNELDFKIQQLSQAATQNSRDVFRIERSQAERPDLKVPRYILTQDQGKWRGHLEGYPDAGVQGESFDEVQFKLWQLCHNLTANVSPLRKIA